MILISQSRWRMGAFLEHVKNWDENLLWLYTRMVGYTPIYVPRVWPKNKSRYWIPAWLVL